MFVLLIFFILSLSANEQQYQDFQRWKEITQGFIFTHCISCAFKGIAGSPPAAFTHNAGLAVLGARAYVEGAMRLNKLNNDPLNFDGISDIEKTQYFNYGALLAAGSDLACQTPRLKTGQASLSECAIPCLIPILCILYGTASKHLPDPD